jgi:hypothetical protein
MTTPKRHHYLPQTYLAEFSRDGHLAVYDRELKELRIQTPKNTAVEKDFYTVIEADGTKRNDIESMFAVIEGHVKPIICRLQARQQISDEEKVNLSGFIGLLVGRTPEFAATFATLESDFTRHMSKLMFHSVEQTEKILDRYKADNPTDNPTTAQELYDFVQQDRYDIEFPRVQTLHMMLHFGETLWKYFVQMDWHVLHSPKDSSFITSDAPFVLVPSKKEIRSPYDNLVGIAIPGVLKLIPLGRTCLLAITDRGKALTHKAVDRHQVRVLNKAIALNAYRFLIGPDRAQIARIAKCINFGNTSWKPHMRFGL